MRAVLRFASNKYRDVLSGFQSSLSNTYSNSEIKVLLDIIFNNILNINNIGIIQKPQYLFTESQLLKLETALRRLEDHEPVQYIIGNTEFYGLKIKVSPSVLIPRPETEELVDLAVKECNKEPKVILDVGTGSGCIALALKTKFKDAKVIGIDNSYDALKVAEENSLANRLNVEFRELDIFKDELPAADLIISNPPYILKSEAKQISRNVKDYEPSEALFVTNNDPMQFYRVIAQKAIRVLPSGGKLFFELNSSYAFDLESVVEEAGFSSYELSKDLSGNIRFATVVK